MDRFVLPLARALRSRNRRTSRSLQLERLEDRSLLASLGDALQSFTKNLASPKAAAALVAASSPKTGGVAALTDDLYENNDSQSLASNLGTISGSQNLTGLVMADSADWFKFTTTSVGVGGDSASISFLNAQGDLDMVLYNSSGQSLGSSTSVGNSETISLGGRAAGTYYVRVYGYRGVTNPGYSLTINKTGTVPTDDQFENNDTSATAKTLGTLAAPTTFNSLVMADAHDWYTFTMNGAGTSTDYVRATFTHAQGDLDMELYNAAGTRVGTSTSATNSEQISLSGLAAGTYRIHVYGYQGVLNPSYSLDISPGIAVVIPPSPPPPPSGGNFNIQFNFSGLSASEQAIFQQAAAKWQSVITGDLPGATYNGIAVDDILIDASATTIDGRGNILGQAGPDRFRSGSSLPYHGMMQFDSADMASMISNGTFLGVILHEMGHVLGVGTLWTTKGLLSGRGGTNPIFTGPRTTAEYNALFGVNAAGVPVENTGGSGTRDAHWRESTFGNELMTGWVGPGTSLPMSRITIASLADIGYTVNLAAADIYAPAGSVQGAASSGSGSGGSLVGLVELPDLEPLSPSRRVAWEHAADAVFSNRRMFDGLFS